MKIEHRPQCHILAAPDGEYVTDIDCDCGATYYTLTSRIAKLEAAALRAAEDLERGKSAAEVAFELRTALGPDYN